MSVALDTGDTKMIKEFENESQQSKGTTASSLEVISSPPPREALVNFYLTKDLIFLLLI